MWTILFCGTIGLFGASLILLVVLKDLPSIDGHNLIFSESTNIYDSSGQHVLYSVHGDQNRKIVQIGEINQNMIAAILAAEDDQFYVHTGFDLGGISMAFCHEILSRASIESGICPPRGGSTITQQLIKNFFLTPEQTFTRKLRELVLAYKIESRYDKNEILELYLNGISFGSNLHGIETASRAFFNTSAKDLTAAQSAILAALPQAPTKYSPYGERAYSKMVLDPEIIAVNNLTSLAEVSAYNDDALVLGLIGREIELAGGETEYLQGRADWVLERMRSLDYITESAYQAARQELRTIDFSGQRESLRAPHFVLWVKQQLEEQFEPALVEQGGLKVYTTLDMSMQQAAERIVGERAVINAEQFDAENAALVAIEPSSGHIRAMVGSADYWNDEIDGKVNVTLQKRLPGSSFKPITYAAAFLAGQLSPARVLFDVETNFGNGWIPQNYDGKFRGPVPVRFALGNSLNIPAVKAAIIAGPDKVYELATQMGISFDREADFYGAAIALGGAEARPIDMASAFSVFVNGGKKVEPIAILRVEDRYGNLLFSAEAETDDDTEEAESQVLDPAIAYQVTDMLADPESRGPGWNSRLQLSGRRNAVKTGTADKKVNNTPWPADCWTIGAIPQLTTAVWVGNSGGEVMGRKASGFEVAAPIWHAFMTEVSKELPVEDFSAPDTVKRVQVSKLSGLLPTEEMSENMVTSDIFSPLNIPQEQDSSLRMIEIDTVSGKLPTELTPEAAIETRAVLSMHSFFPELEHWEAPVQNWLAENKESLIERYGITDEILTEMPTEQDDVHTPAAKADAPQVSFLSPRNDNMVAPKRSTVRLDISVPNGFQEVVFYWNDRRIESADKQKEEYVIPVPPSARGTNFLRAEVIDRLLYSGSSEVKVKVGEDDTAPEISILTPRENEVVMGGSLLKISVDASDRLGAMQKVDFYIDDQRIGVDLFTPYEYEWKVPNRDGTYTLRAVARDMAGNEGEATREFEVEQQPVSDEFGIVTPPDGSLVSCSDQITVRAGVVGETRERFERLEIWAENDARFKTRIGEFTELSENGFFDTRFTPDNCGEWKFYAKTFLTEGAPRVSSRNFIEFTE